MKYQNVSWHEIEVCVETVGRVIRAARFKPDCIVAILKGGLVPARLLSDFFGSIEIYPIRAKTYHGIRKLERVRLEYFRYPISRKNVLLVDDIHDSGKTLQKVMQQLRRHHPHALYSTTLYYKRGADYLPDFQARTVPADVWIVFPWERHEGRRS